MDEEAAARKGAAAQTRAVRQEREAVSLSRKRVDRVDRVQGSWVCAEGKVSD